MNRKRKQTRRRTSRKKHSKKFNRKSRRSRRSRRSKGGIFWGPNELLINKDKLIKKLENDVKLVDEHRYKCQRELHKCQRESRKKSKNLPVVKAYHLKPSAPTIEELNYHLKPSAPTIEELNRSYNSSNSKKNKKKK